MHQSHFCLVLLWLRLEAIRAANQTGIKQSLMSSFMTGLQALSLQNVEAHLCLKPLNCSFIAYYIIDLSFAPKDDDDKQ